MKPKLYHLSHIDLDGYGCQYLTTQTFDEISCYNANYGPEIAARLKEIVNHIKKDGNQSNAIILITDLNLSQKEANWIEKEAEVLRAGLQLLDHHITGEKTALSHLWYHLNTAHCGTWLTYEWLQDKYDFDAKNELKQIVDTIDAVDMWHSKDALFEYGKVMMSMLSSAKEINRTMFPTEDTAFKLSLIEHAKSMLGNNNAHITLDDAIHRLKKEFFIFQENNTKDNLVASYITSLLSSQKERFTITYQGYKGMLGYNIGNTSIIGNAFLVQNPDYNFYMDINYRGSFSLRGNDTLDLSVMAAHVGNGGGHKNASGGKIEGYVDSFIYEEVRNFVQAYLNDKSFENKA
ncbi:MAG: phosphoesterase [Sulfurovaceae bacterium]|nr:phosphoesterase [Sulfurovaceae bacterium]